MGRGTGATETSRDTLLGKRRVGTEKDRLKKEAAEERARLEAIPPTESSFFRKKWKNEAGELHREGDLPAVKTGSLEEYWIDGKKHRADGKPAIKELNETLDREEYWVDGERHRGGDLPSVIVKELNLETGEWQTKTEEYHKHGRLHREEGKPAGIYAYDDPEWTGPPRMEYWVEGVKVKN